MAKAMNEMKGEMKDMSGQMVDIEGNITRKLKAELPQIIKDEVRLVGKEIERKIEKKVEEMEVSVTKKVEKVEVNVQKQVEEVNRALQGMKQDLANKEDIGELVKEEMKKEFKKREDEMKTRGATANTQGAMGIQVNPVSPGTQMRMTVAHVTKEIKDKEERRKSFVIYNLEEPQTNKKEERISKDKEEVIKVVQEVLKGRLEGEDMVEATRLGKDKTEGKRRPLLITVREERTKASIFSRLASLRN